MTLWVECGNQSVLQKSEVGQRKQEMKKTTFSMFEKPLLTCMVQARTPERVKELVDVSRTEGAEAFGMQLCKLQAEYRTPEVYRDLFAFAAPYRV